MTYHSVVLGGTFDRLHTGHHELLKQAFSVGDHITIGFTTDQYIAEFKSPSSNRKQVQPFGVRKKVLTDWLEAQGWGGRYTIVPIDDHYGPTLQKDMPFDAIVVSPHTQETAEKINHIRKEHEMSPLEIVTVVMIPAEDLKPISSTRIRKGDIDTRGRLTLPGILRSELKKPIGDIISNTRISETINNDKHKAVYTVGDMTTKRILDHHIIPVLSVIDFQMDRKPFLWDSEHFDRLTSNRRVMYVQSGPGYISQDAIDAVKHCDVLVVDGEEDLLVLPVILEAPLGSILYYGQPRVDEASRACSAGSRRVEAGQPKKGLVRVEVTEEKKRQAKSLLKKFVLSSQS